MLPGTPQFDYTGFSDRLDSDQALAANIGTAVMKSRAYLQGEKLKADAMKEAARSQSGGGNPFGRIFGGLAGSVFGPIGSAIGSSVAGSLFG